MQISALFLFPMLCHQNMQILNKVLITTSQKYQIDQIIMSQTLKMSQNCIEYQDYKRIIEEQANTPRRNIFEQNRIFANQIQKLSQQNIKLNNQLSQLKNICSAIIDAIGRVFSQDLAVQLQEILQNCENQSEKMEIMSNTIFQALMTHQSQPTVSDWSQSRTSRRKQMRTPERISCENKQNKSFREQTFRQQNKISPILSSRRHESSRSPNSMAASTKNNDPSTSRSNFNPNILSSRNIIATGISCEICDQTFAPNQFIEHASRCKEDRQYSSGSVINMSCNSEQDSNFSYKLESNESESLRELKQINDIDLQDTHDRRLKKQSEGYLKMMKNLILMQNQIEQQIQLIKCSKQRIDRDAQKRKLEKDLAKVMYVIEQKKKQVKQNEKNSKMMSNSSKCAKFKKMSTNRNKN